MNKIFIDNVHGYIKLSELAISIIDTPEYQRLRKLKQLGVAYLVFPCSTHSRFEHSLGVYHLAGVLLDNLREKQSELNLSNRTIELVKIAGLVHDLGHGPFSHAYDDTFLSCTMDKDEKNRYHENRSIDLFCYIIKKYDINIADNEIKFVSSLINPKMNQKGYIYQIISNPINTIDVDKFDYIARDSYNIGLDYGFNYRRVIEEARVIDDNICYPEKMSYEIVKLFDTRYNLHKQIYNHPMNLAIEFMIKDCLLLVDKEFKLTEKTRNIEQFYKLNDNIINDIEDKSVNKEAKRLINRIHRRQLYLYVGEYNKNIESKINIIANMIKEKFSVDESDILFTKMCIGYVSGNKPNPLDNIYYFNKYDYNKSFRKNTKDISNLISQNFTECRYKLYIKNYKLKDKKKDIIKEINSLIQHNESCECD